jgi:hypothetical protein
MPTTIKRGDGEDGRLVEVRNCWQLCHLAQFVGFFHGLLKIGDSEIETAIDVLEEDLMGLNGEGMLVPRVLDGLLRLLTSKQASDDALDARLAHVYHRHGQDWDRTYMEVDWFQRLEVLVQLAQWVSYQDRFREKLDTGALGAPAEEYRIMPVGWQGEQGSYYLFDDNRLYLKTDFKPDLSDVEPIPIKPKKRRKIQTLRRRRRRVLMESVEPDQEQEEEEEEEEHNEPVVLREALAREYEPEWKCVCWDLPSWRSFAGKIKRTNKTMYLYVTKEVIPVVEEHDQIRARAALSRERVRTTAALVANRKRSSRLEVKRLEREQEEERRLREEVQRQKLEEEAEHDRERLIKEEARERRFREREERKRYLLERSTKRTRQKAMDDYWVFDCSCGAHGENFDDGEPSVACEICDTWMHVGCLSPEERAKVDDDQTSSNDDYQFVCSRCRHLGQDQQNQTTIIYEKTIEGTNGGIISSMLSQGGSDLQKQAPEIETGAPPPQNDDF